MNTKAEQNKEARSGDIGKLCLAAVIVLASLVGYIWLGRGSVPQSVRLLGLIAGLVVALVLAAFTKPGQRVRHYMVESQFELRKVVWPTRDETIKITLIIIVVTILLSLLLGLIDLTLKSLILDWLLKLG